MVTLKNGNSVLKINKKGAEMKSFTVNGVEYLWVGDPAIWAASTPNLFPMTGGFRDDKYVLNDKEYFMLKHGFAKNMDFEVEAETENTATFLLKSNEETKAGFPYDFELRVSYILTEGKVTASYSVKNLSDDTMWFSIGSHDGFATPEGIEEYDVIFPQKETLDTYTPRPAVCRTARPVAAFSLISPDALDLSFGQSRMHLISALSLGLVRLITLTVIMILLTRKLSNHLRQARPLMPPVLLPLWRANNVRLYSKKESSFEDLPYL